MDEPCWLPSITWDLDGPEAREHAAVFVLPESRKVLVLGGSGYAPYLDPLDDGWSFDLDSQTWTPAAVRGDVPSGGGSRRVATTGPGTAYLFGGYGYRMAPNNELFRVDYGDGALTFTRAPQAGPPSPRSLHVFAYDEARERFLLFGGVDTAPLGDLWTMRLEDGTAVWTEIPYGPGPSPRYGSFYGLDARNGRLLLFSGAQGTASIDAARDTWVLDLRAQPPAWTLLAEGAACPAGRRNGCTVFDPDTSRLFVFGGTADGRTTQPGCSCWTRGRARSSGRCSSWTASHLYGPVASPSTTRNHGCPTWASATRTSTCSRTGRPSATDTTNAPESNLKPK